MCLLTGGGGYPKVSVLTWTGARGTYLGQGGGVYLPWGTPSPILTWLGGGVPTLDGGGGTYLGVPPPRPDLVPEGVPQGRYPLPPSKVGILLPPPPPRALATRRAVSLLRSRRRTLLLLLLVIIATSINLFFVHDLNCCCLSN